MFISEAARLPPHAPQLKRKALGCLSGGFTMQGGRRSYSRPGRLPVSCQWLTALGLLALWVGARLVRSGGRASGIRVRAPKSASNRPIFDLRNRDHVVEIDRIRQAFASEIEAPSDYADCLFRPTRDLPCPKPHIEAALQASLAFATGQSDSPFLSPSLRSPEVVDLLRSCLQLLDRYLDVPPHLLPREVGKNADVGFELMETMKERRRLRS